MFTSRRQHIVDNQKRLSAWNNRALMDGRKGEETDAQTKKYASAKYGGDEFYARTLDTTA